jgi:hypothetical protein
MAVGHDAFRHLPKVRCPVDLACGELTDSFGETVLRAIDARLTAAGGTCSVTVFPDLDHFGPMNRPDLVAASVAQAFSSEPAGSPAAGSD